MKNLQLPHPTPPPSRVREYIVSYRELSNYLFKDIADPAKSYRTMAYLILDLSSQLGKCLPIFSDHKNRVIAETGRPTPFFGNESGAIPFCKPDIA